MYRTATQPTAANALVARIGDWPNARVGRHRLTRLVIVEAGLSDRVECLLDILILLCRRLKKAHPILRGNLFAALTCYSSARRQIAFIPEQHAHGVAGHVLKAFRRSIRNRSPPHLAHLRQPNRCNSIERTLSPRVPYEFSMEIRHGELYGALAPLQNVSRRPPFSAPVLFQCTQ